MKKKEPTKEQKKMLEKATFKEKKKEHPLHKAIASPMGKSAASKGKMADHLGKAFKGAITGSGSAKHLSKGLSGKRKMEDE